MTKKLKTRKWPTAPVRSSNFVYRNSPYFEKTYLRYPVGRLLTNTKLDLNDRIPLAPVASFIFVLTLATSLLAFSNQNIYAKFILNPYEVSRGYRVYTIITSGLIHADWNHLFFNMLSYYFFAFQLEAVLGHWQFGVLYMASMILATCHLFKSIKKISWYNSLGASGAISAVYSALLCLPKSANGAYIFALPDPRLDLWYPLPGVLPLCIQTCT
jgi:membrane associated rhomboid family serine protease